MSKYFPTFDRAIIWSEGMLIQEGQEVDAGKWQGIHTEGHPSLVTLEVINLAIQVPTWRIGDGSEDLDIIADEIKPNRKWADEHFNERVGGIPYNPDPSHERWPWWRGQDDTTKVDGKFTHTYSERFWPKLANRKYTDPWMDTEVARGIRYVYGDLYDVVELLWREPRTRQAYLPIFFPEDTGAVHRGRTPCSLGYHFLLRNNFFHMWYDIRSCDAVRHFRDDLYLAVRLQRWMLDTLQELGDGSDNEQLWADVYSGLLYFTAHSFHVHKGDYHHLQEQWNETMA